MSLYLPHQLPALERLKGEGLNNLFSVKELPTDAKPKKIALFNLMPVKENTEEDFARLLSNAACDIELILVRMENHISKNTSYHHLSQFYTTYSQIANQKIDGVIITGAPVELMNFEEVGYWEELTTIFEWCRASVQSALFICWGAQAALYHYFKIPKHILPTKQFGVFEHCIHTPNEPIFTGFDDLFFVPHSRHTATFAADILAHSGLQILSTSDDSGVYMVREASHPFFYITGHSEYAPNTLANEYIRDMGKGLAIDLPANYYRNNNPNESPIVRWRAHAHHLFLNWVKYYLN